MRPGGFEVGGEGTKREREERTNFVGRDDALSQRDQACTYIPRRRVALLILILILINKFVLQVSTTKFWFFIQVTFDKSE